MSTTPHTQLEPAEGIALSLKCVICGHKEQRSAEACKGSDNPMCSKCMGPMIADSAKVRMP